MTLPLIIKQYGLTPYDAAWQQMKDFVANRIIDTPDECWLMEHPPLFTQGQSGKKEHVLNPGDIAIIESDRGGQVTYHGPGQLMAYFLIDLKRRRLNVHTLVQALEQIVIDVLMFYGIKGQRQSKAPGVYVENAKIASIGLRIRKGFSYHGLSFNINMDLEPFTRINPCGYPDLKMTQLTDFIPTADMSTVKSIFIDATVQTFTRLEQMV